jgi:peptidoglycan LD-endopeptidase CwlK
MDLDQISLQRISALHPAIKDEVLSAFTHAQNVVPSNMTIRIVQGLRTFPEQHALYLQRPKVTNSDAGQSYHNYGLAIDFCFIIDGAISWKVNPNWMKVVNIFKATGYKWGGDWINFKDLPHLEKTFGYNWRQLLAKYNAKDFIPGTSFVNL